jgi:N-acetylmuramate 1-kinase
VHLKAPLDNASTLIAMDAPPPQEDCTPFVKVARLFADAGLNVPKIIAENVSLGFLLLSDLGDLTYLKALNNETAKHLYHEANLALIQLQLASRTNVLPPYDEALLLREMQLFPEWYVAQHLKVTLDEKQQLILNNTFALLNQNVLAQGQVYVHRDFHARNLMVTQPDNPGILDFQDAVFGPITYDLVSLYKDAYIEWDEEQIIDWLVRYWQVAKKAGLAVNHDFSEFYRDFEYMGAQRHIKILGIFARLSHRDGKHGYVKDMPLVMHYLRKVCARYIELKPMLRLLDTLENTQPQVGYTF